MAAAKPADSLEVMRKRMAVVHPATFVKKSAYDRYGTFDLKYKCQMDRDLLLRMYVAGAKFQYLNEDLAMMRLGGVNQRTYVKQTVPEVFLSDYYHCLWKFWAGLFLW